MDPIIVKSLEARLKECEMKICAILDALKLDCEYTPESYKLVQPEGDDE